MERIFHYSITEKDAGKDIHAFLREHGYSRHILASMKPDPQAILVNGVHQFMCFVLHEGDVLTTRVCDPESSPNITPAPVPFSIIYEDEDILIVDKPAGESIHPAVSHPADTLANGIAWYYQQQGIPFVVRCINRLDRDTTGLLIVAKNLVSACILEQALLRREIHRTYLALAEGQLPPEGTIDLPIARKPGSLIERCVDPEQGDRAVTHYHLLQYIPAQSARGIPARSTHFHADHSSEIATCPDHTLPDGQHSHLPGPQSEQITAHPDFTEVKVPGRSVLALRLETGRTHQIRVHMAHIGHPLLGDTLYNPDYLRKPEDPVPPDVCIARQALHSWKLDFTHPISGEPLHFEAPVPADMLALM